MNADKQDSMRMAATGISQPFLMGFSTISENTAEGLKNMVKKEFNFSRTGLINFGVLSPIEAFSCSTKLSL